MIGKGSNPSVSPKEDWILFSRGGRLHKASFDSTKKSNPLFQARGRNRNPVWSPNGEKLAFVSSRDDHNYIGIYDFQNNTITWIAPGVDRDNYPVWSPDGKQIAFIRIPGVMVEPQQRREAGLPFALWIADVESGEEDLDVPRFQCRFRPILSCPCFNVGTGQPPGVLFRTRRMDASLFSFH